MNEYGTKAFDPYVHGEPDRPVDPDPDRTFLGLLRRELMTATEREKKTRAVLAEHQAKADACTREREAIERAIKAYQREPEMNADRVVADKGWQVRHGVDTIDGEQVKR